MKKINTFLIISLLLFSMLIIPDLTEKATAITQHEASDGTTYGRIIYDSTSGTVSLTLRPNAIGTYAQHSSSGCSDNYECVDEVSSDGDTTYIYDPDLGGRPDDSYNIPDHTTQVGEIDNITVFVVSRNDVGDSSFIEPRIRIGGSLYAGTEFSLTSSWTEHSYVWTTNPNSGEAWTWSNVDSLEIGVRSRLVNGFSRTTQIYARVYYDYTYNVTRNSESSYETDSLSFSSPNDYTGSVTLKVPVSTEIDGIAYVQNNSDSGRASEVDTYGELSLNKFYYDSADHFVYIRIDDLSTSETENWTIKCNKTINFYIDIPRYLDVGDYFMSRGLITDANDNPLDGIVAKTYLKYENQSVAYGPVAWYCSDGNYQCTFSTNTLKPNTYGVEIYFYYSATNETYKKGFTLYLSVDPSSDVHVSSNLYFTFYDNNTGMGLNPESFKIYASTDTTVDSEDRIYATDYTTYTGQTIYYRVDDYFDNQVYPLSGDYQILEITSVNQFEDIPIDWYSFSVKNMNHSIVHFKMTNDSRTYSQYLYPYEPFYWNVLNGTYTINLTYYNAETDAIENYSQENITITDDTYYWIRGYDLQDIIIEIQVTNTSLGTIVLNIDTNIGIVNSTVNDITTTIVTDISLFESNITSLVNNIWSQLNITDSVVDYLNTTVNVNILRVNTTINYINDTVWRNFTLINQTINNTHVSIITSIDLSEQNLTSLQLDIWTSLNLTDAVIDWINTTIWSEFTFVNTTVNAINNKLTINFDMLNVTVDYINNTIWTEFNTVNSNINSIENTIVNVISLSETNLTTLNNQIWNSINITDSVIDYINNTLWNEISAVNVTIDYLNNTIWTNFSLIDSDIDTLSVSVHTSLTASETNISNIIYNVWSALNLTNVTIDYLNASIWNEFSIIQSNLNNTNLSIINMILLTENNISSLIITISNIIDYALMPDIEIISFNPPMIFSVYDKEGMAIGGNVYKICPALSTTATTRVETTGNWINSTAQIPGNDTVENGTVIILKDILYISGSGSISYINITYTDNSTLMQNTTYIPSKINLYGQNLTINASNDIHILRETTYNQVTKFYWIYEASTGGHTAGINIINPMTVPIYVVYIYVEFSNKSTPDPNTVIMRDIANDGIIRVRGEDYDMTLSGIHFYLLSIESDSTRGFTIEYTKRFDDAYRYGEETINVPGYIETTWNGLSYNTFDISWINDKDTIFRGALYAKIGFDAPTEIDGNSIRIWDEDNNQELSESDFIFGSDFIRIDADGLGDVTPGSGRTFNVYFLLAKYPGADPTEIHLNTQLWAFHGFAITPFLFIFIFCLILMAGCVYGFLYSKKVNRKIYLGGFALGGFTIFISYICAFMGV